MDRLFGGAQRRSVENTYTHITGVPWVCCRTPSNDAARALALATLRRVQCPLAPRDYWFG